MPFRVIRRSFDGTETEVSPHEAAQRIAQARCEEVPYRNESREYEMAADTLSRGFKVPSKCGCVYWQEPVVVDDIDAIHQQNEKVTSRND